MFLEKPNRARDKKAEAKAKLAAWVAVRKQVLARDEHRCRACGSREQVDVHHIKFRSAGGSSTDTRNLLALCRIDHNELHAYRLSIVGKNANKTLKFVRRG